ncbi:hypothetical protein K501DRAFT_335184 [Backusella circina FSU 941]|nr:hypothetical protein K501DRAFT_335184 [Backusella circina FSU 941]
MSEKHVQEACHDNCADTKKKTLKPHVPTACINCKKAHLACDLSRPCQRCVSTDKSDTCHDIKHKKRGRPKLQGPGTTSKKPKVQYVKGPIQYTPELVHCSFLTTQSGANAKSMPLKENQIMSIVLSMDLRCSRVSDESLDFFGFYPQEFSHRSLYDFLPPDQTDKISEIHQQLLDNAIHQHKTALPATPRSFSDKFFSASPSELLRIANGSQTLKNKLKFSGKHHSVEVEARFYLGGGLGADLFESDSLDQLYIVCILSESQICGREQTSPALNPAFDPIMLQPSLINPSAILSASLASSSPLTSFSLNTEENIYSFIEKNNTNSDNSFIDDPFHIESPLSLISEEDDDHHHSSSSSSNGSTPYNTSDINSIMSELLHLPSDTKIDQVNNNLKDMCHLKTPTHHALLDFQPTIALQNLDELSGIGLGLK